jgi:hypothetical protein
MVQLITKLFVVLSEALAEPKFAAVVARCMEGALTTAWASTVTGFSAQPLVTRCISATIRLQAYSGR